MAETPEQTLVRMLGLGKYGETVVAELLAEYREGISLHLVFELGVDGAHAAEIVRTYGEPDLESDQS